MMNTFKLEGETILKRLEAEFKVEQVMYNIMTDNLVYTDVKGEKRRISVESLIKHIEMNGIKDRELYEILKMIHASYFNRRIKDFVCDMYTQRGLEVPRDVFIHNGFIQFTIDGEVIPIEYHDHFDTIECEFNEVCQLNK